MQNEVSDIKKWGYIGVIFSVFVILLSIIGFFVNYRGTFRINYFNWWKNC